VFLSLTFFGVYKPFTGRGEGVDIPFAHTHLRIEARPLSVDLTSFLQLAGMILTSPNPVIISHLLIITSLVRITELESESYLTDL